jgi:hypothetical protein
MREWRYGSTFLDLGARWRCMISFTPRSFYSRRNSLPYPMDRRLGGPQGRSGHCRKEKRCTTRKRRYIYWAIQTSIRIVGLKKFKLRSLFKSMTKIIIQWWLFITSSTAFTVSGHSTFNSTELQGRFCHRQHWGIADRDNCMKSHVLADSLNGSQASDERAQSPRRAETYVHPHRTWSARVWKRSLQQF